MSTHTPKPVESWVNLSKNDISEKLAEEHIRIYGPTRKPDRSYYCLSGVRVGTKKRKRLSTSLNIGEDETISDADWIDFAASTYLKLLLSMAKVVIQYGLVNLL